MLKNSKVVLFLSPLKSWSGRKLLDPTTYFIVNKSCLDSVEVLFIYCYWKHNEVLNTKKRKHINWSKVSCLSVRLYHPHICSKQLTQRSTILPVNELQIATVEFAVDLGSGFCWGRATLSCFWPVSEAFQGYVVTQLVEALRYKEGHGFDFRWYHWNFSFWPHYGPGVDSASNRNECQEYFLGV